MIASAMLSCAKDEINEQSKITQTGPKETKISKNAIAKLALLFGEKNIASPSLENSTRVELSVEGSDSTDFSSKEVESITPIELIDSKGKITDSIDADKVPVLYVVNYAQDNGYLIVDMNENNFPIISFNSKGSFHFNELDSLQKIEFQEQYVSYVVECNGEKINIWDDIVDCMNNPELNDDGIPVNSTDSVCVTTIEFQPVDSLEEANDRDSVLIADDLTTISEDIPHAEATRAIADRSKPKNRPSRYPLVGIWGLKWHRSNPYNIEMPYEYGGAHIAVPSISVALSKIMYRHWWPSRFNWMYMPRQVPAGQKSLVSSMLKDISENIGCTRSGSYSYDLPCNRISNIPNALKTKFEYTSGGTLVQYKNDESTFLSVYNSLRCYHPVLFCAIPSYYNLNSTQHMGDSWIVDGYQEIRVKVVKKWYFIGICYKKRTYYYYRDYFHYISSMNAYSKKKGQYYNEEYDGWFRYDYKTNNRNKNYAIVDIKPSY